jgi:hypothetical protein
MVPGSAARGSPYTETQGSWLGRGQYQVVPDLGVDRPPDPHPCQDDSREGIVGRGLVVLAYTPAEPRAEEADQVTGHRAETFIPMGMPLVFLQEHLLPRLHEGLDGSAPICQGCSGASNGVRGESPVGQRGETGAPAEQEPTGDERPKEPEHTKIRTDGHVGQYRTQQDRNTVDCS